MKNRVKAMVEKMMKAAREYAVQHMENDFEYRPDGTIKTVKVF